MKYNNQKTPKERHNVVATNLNRDDVSVLSVDDINLRKGNYSTACSVFIDAQTHRVLAIIQGSSSERATNVIKNFPSAKFKQRNEINLNGIK